MKQNHTGLKSKICSLPDDATRVVGQRGSSCTLTQELVSEFVLAADFCRALLIHLASGRGGRRMESIANELAANPR